VSFREIILYHEDTGGVCSRFEVDSRAEKVCEFHA